MGKSLDLTNQKFGRLTALYKTDKKNSSGQIYWHCQCDCGNECDVTGSSLKNGHTKSCGCYNIEKIKLRNCKKLEDLTGKRFYKLTVLYRAENHIQIGGEQKTQWHCKCDCGNECNVNAYRLKMGYVKSCGCIKKSYGEELIFSILRENNLFFQEEYSFKDCIFKDSNKLARFDFYVDNKYLIEFDGKQHFIEDAGWGEPLSEIQKRDNYKNEYCLRNNIPLYRIPYTEINNIKNISDILQEKFLVKK